MLQTLASTRIGFELEFRFGPFWVQIHLGLNLIKDWTLWANPWLTNGLTKRSDPFLKGGARDSLSSPHVRTPRNKKLHAPSFLFFLDAIPANKNNKIYGNVFEMDKRERSIYKKSR